MTCYICGKPINKNRRYCARCRRLFKRYPTTFLKEALKAAYSQELDAFLCYFSDLKLDENDINNPLHLVIDHRTPGDITTLAVTADFINQLKCALTEDEFRRFIPMLADHLELGTPFIKEAFKLDHYYPNIPEKEIKYPSSRIWSAEHCLICGKDPIKHGLFCYRCAKLMKREHGNIFRRNALIQAYDKEADAFRCHYTGVIVDLEDFKNPWHISFDHRIPGRPETEVVAVGIVNNMKSALCEEEFLIIVRNLAKHFRTGEPFDLGGVEFEYWGNRGNKEKRKGAIRVTQGAG